MSGRTALIGSTGLVGGTLLRQTDFDDRFHSTDIEDIAGRDYGLVVCAGAPAVKWKANREPEADRANLDRLMEALGRAHADHVILISTVDVYAQPVDVDESTPVDGVPNHAYGTHRRALERFVEQRFPSTIVRLPGLFGAGLKKNVIYDFLHGNLLDQVDAGSVFQFYDLRRLWADLQAVRALGLPLVNLPTEPVSVADVAAHGFGIRFDNRTEAGPARYDMRTRHAAALGGGNGYLEDASTVLERIARYAASEGWVRP